MVKRKDAVEINPRCKGVGWRRVVCMKVVSEA